MRHTHLPAIFSPDHKPAAITPVVNSHASETQGKVAVIGAGIAGLTCAYRLQQRRIRSDVFEGRDRVGGRILTHHQDGQHAELGAEFIDSNHRVMHRLVRDLNLTLIDLRSPENWKPPVFHVDGRRWSMAQIAQPLQAVVDAARRDLAAVGGRPVTYRTGARADWLSRLSLSEWFDRHHFSGVTRTILEIAYTNEFGLEADEQGSLNMLEMIAHQPESPELYGENDEKWHLAESNSALVETLAKHLQRPVALQSRLENVAPHHAGGFCLTFSTAAGTLETVYDQVVFALPFTMLRQVDLSRCDLSARKRQAIAQAGYGRNAKRIARFSERAWHPESGLSYADSYGTSWEATRGLPGKRGMMVQYLGGEAAQSMRMNSLAEDGRRFADQLDQVFPGSAAAYTDTISHHWPSDPFIQASYSAYLPGQHTTLRGAEGEPEGALHFAGEHTSLYAHGFMEGAAESGERAATEVAAALGERRAYTRPEGLRTQPGSQNKL